MKEKWNKLMSIMKCECVQQRVVPTFLHPPII